MNVNRVRPDGECPQVVLESPRHRRRAAASEKRALGWTVGDITKDYNAVREALGAICRWYGRLPPRRAGRDGVRPSIFCIICLHSLRSTGKLGLSVG